MVNRTKFPFSCKICGFQGGISHAGMCLKCYNAEYHKAHREQNIINARNWRNNNIERCREKARKSSKKRWHSLTKEEKLIASRKQEARRGKEERIRRKEYAKRYYRNNKSKWQENVGNDGKPCSICGKIDEQIRYISGKCRSCYRKENWKKTHPQNVHFCTICGKQLGSKAKNTKCLNCRQRERYKNDPEYREGILKRNKRNNQNKSTKEKKTLSTIRRRARIAKTEISLTKKEWETILEEFDHRCAYCGTSERIELDHVIPISKGGSTTKDNVVPACRSCNSRKGNRLGWIPVKPS